MKVIVHNYKNQLSLRNKLGRLAWNITYCIFFYPFALKKMNPWRIFLLKLYGAKITYRTYIASNVKIWAPWNLEMAEYTLLAANVYCYNPDKIKIGSETIISQSVYLCTASHDITNATHPLITRPIIIEDQVWIAVDAFIMMGVTIGQGAVVGARSAVFKDVEPWTVVGGNPSKFIKKRVIK